MIPAAPARLRAVAIAAVAGAILLFLVGARHRVPNTDEGYFASAARNLALHGFLGTTNLEPAGRGLLRIERRTYWVTPLLLLLEAAWYRVAPATILSTRLLNLPLLPLGLAAYSLVVLRLAGDGRVAALAAALLALDYQFLNAATAARPELLCFTLGVLGLAAHLALREHELSRAALSGHALAALALLAHPNGLLYSVGLATLALLLDRDRLAPRHLALACVPYALAGAAWGAYALQDTEAFLAQLRGNALHADRFPSTPNPLAILWRELHLRYGTGYGLASAAGLARLKAVTLLAYAAAVAAVALAPRRRRGPLRPVLALAAVVFAAQCVFNQKLVVYLIHVVPWYAALLAGVAVERWEARPRLRGALAAGLAVLAGLQAGGFLVVTLQRSAPARQAAVASFLARSTEARLVFASSSLAFATGFDPRLLDDAELGTRSGRAAEMVVVDEFWRAHWGGWRARRPAAMARIDAALGAYERVFDEGGYQIYARRAVATGPPEPR